LTFKELGLSAPLLKAIQEQGYTKATPIQEQAIPVVLQKKDILAGAQTGTGKTAGFTLPLLELLSRAKPTKEKRPVRALIFTPTRELAAQVGESVSLYGKHLPFRSTVIFGGVKINPQITQLRKGVDIIVATPGRLFDHISQGTLKLSQVEFFILDEADRMLDMGFVNDIKKIMKLLPKERQNLLFSATYSDKVRKLSKLILTKPAFIEASTKNSTVDTINQKVYLVDRERKAELLAYIIG